MAVAIGSLGERDCKQLGTDQDEGELAELLGDIEPNMH